MTRTLGALGVFLLATVSAFGQSGSPWRTSADVIEGSRGSIVGTVTDSNDARNVLTLDTDDPADNTITVVADSVSTQFNGFGGVINGAPEIFVGSKGFANVRLGDRVEVRGVGQANRTIRAEYVTLRGRAIAASPVGVGETRPPSQISTPTAGPTTSAKAGDQFGRVEGLVRQVNSSQGLIVIETDGREILTVRTATATPVWYRGESYNVRNLDVGDRIRVELEPRSNGSNLLARSVDVLQSVQENPNASTTRVGSISGRVTSVDRQNNYVRIDTTGRGDSVRVDLRNANDPSGRGVRAGDLRVGDTLEISGSYSANQASTFNATTVRQTEDPFPTRPPDTGSPGYDNGAGDFTTVTIYGTVTGTLDAGPRLTLRDNQGRTVSVLVTEDFVVRGKAASTYVTADRLKSGDAVVVKAYQDPTGDYIAQTIRQR
ncbi:MAG: hypothetical protein JOZ54_09340 [Acidobacteria bacterium]|nr:hypothetical protein [Acidobacteriota bacterium]